VESTFFFGDNTTTACSDFTMAGRVCMYGTAVPSGDDYSAWGAGMGLHLATTDGGGNVVAPFDAESLGIAGFRVTLSNVMGRPVRLQISQVDDPAITESNANYQANGFVQGGSAPMAVSADGEVEAMFTEFALPEWTELMGGVEGQMVDPSQIHALQFQIANNPPDPTVPYSVCISGLTWLDAAGGVVDAPDPEPMAGGGMGGMPGGGMGGTPMGGSPGGGMGGSPGGGMGGTPMGGMPGGGMGGGGGDAPSFAADIHPIFTENCTPCHDTGTMSAGRTHGQADVNAAYMSATMMPEVIVEMVTSGQMPLGGMLTQEEIDLIVAWVDGGTPE
jgi:hypothetical protein